jgi:3-ketosteroid 9alpha-monooxygenase subunit A
MATSADYRLGEYAFGRGWFCIAESADITRQPATLHYFGQDLVAWRGESGQVAVLDAYCPHMGTHLNASQRSATVESGRWLEGDNIRCPFHGWRFGPDGVCNLIPYHDGPIPPAARIRSWPIQERCGVVFVWHDPERLDPAFSLPEVPEWNDPEWVGWRRLDHIGDLGHPIEIFDNTSDTAHLEHLHGGRVIAYENEVIAQEYHQRVRLAADLDVLSSDDTAGINTISRYVGPGIFVSRFVEAEMIEFILTTPIADGTARLWQATLVKARPGMDEAAAREWRDTLNHSILSGLMRDAEIWANKAPALQVMQLPGDGPFRQARVWYSQFFNPRDKADGIVARVSGKHTARGVRDWSSLAA